ncbi:hypothetical protein BV898_10523 [Hypsibius exemplaris]|uniref:Uncharacterized protein n=1 Tax=Hypsibius exemplaris TaxID=2072580 RepID=A0A1W0WJF8_HYPEX|nr:hypothetical protein BV898_10523 [Hypsibius exemplaris]
MAVLIQLTVLVLAYLASTSAGNLVVFADLHAADVVPQQGSLAQPSNHGDPFGASSISESHESSSSSSSSEENEVKRPTPEVLNAIAHRIARGEALKVSYERRRSWSFNSRKEQKGRPHRYNTQQQQHHEGFPIHHGIVPPPSSNVVQPVENGLAPPSTPIAAVEPNAAAQRLILHGQGQGPRKPNQHPAGGKKPLVHQGVVAANPTSKRPPPKPSTVKPSTAAATPTKSSAAPSTKEAVSGSTTVASTSAAGSGTTSAPLNTTEIDFFNLQWIN